MHTLCTQHVFNFHYIFAHIHLNSTFLTLYTSEFNIPTIVFSYSFHTRCTYECKTIHNKLIYHKTYHKTYIYTISHMKRVFFFFCSLVQQCFSAQSIFGFPIKHESHVSFYLAYDTRLCKFNTKKILHTVHICTSMQNKDDCTRMMEHASGSANLQPPYLTLLNKENCSLVHRSELQTPIFVFQTFSLAAASRIINVCQHDTYIFLSFHTLLCTC